MRSNYVCETFALGDLGEWQGIHIPNETWNGFSCPMFTLDTCREIAAVVNAIDDNCERIDISDEGRVFSVWMDGDHGHGEEAEEVEPIRVAGADFFPLGAFGWTWTVAVEPSEGDAQ